MTTAITYAGKQIDLGDLDALFAIGSNIDYMAQSLEIICNMPTNVWSPLNTADPNYFLFVKSLVYLDRYNYFAHYGFTIEFNSDGRPFGKMKKRMLIDAEIAAYKNNLHKKFEHSYNIYTLAALNNKQPTMENTPSTTTSIELVSTSQAQAAFASAKSQVTALIANCNSIPEITTAEQAKQVQENAKQLKAVIDSGDETRKQYKEPYFQACKLIDATYKEVMGDADSVLAKEKSKLTAWNGKLLADKAKKDKEAADLRAQQDKIAQMQKTEIGLKGIQLIEFESLVYGELCEAKTRERLGDIWVTRLQNFDPSENVWGALAPFAADINNRLNAFGVECDEFLQKQNEVTKQTFAITKSKYAVVSGNAAKEIYAAIEAAQHQVTIVAETAKSEITQAQIADKPTLAPVRRSPIKYEVTDINAVPDEYKTLIPAHYEINDDKIQEIIKNYSKEIDAGQTIAGLRFWRDETAVIK